MITLIVYLKFFLVSMVFYGLALNAVNYSANPFVYMMLGGLAEVPAYTVTAPIVASLGRRIPSILFYLLSGATIFALAFIKSVTDVRVFVHICVPVQSKSRKMPYMLNND
ncbi:hypothetical protein SK128_005747 [Halocaridina rubra]|uniref:Uncharacterized protein n=1 Tax=Halocaridina rubra TaxID=373956 RepID=A0AAN8ZSU0_HALRR